MSRRKKIPVLRTVADLDPWDRRLVEGVVAGYTHAEIAVQLEVAHQTVVNRISMLGARLRSVPGPTPVRRILRWALLHPAAPDSQNADTLAE